MNKKQLIKKYYIQKEKLNLKNKHYKDQVEKFEDFYINQDLYINGDVTTKFLIKKPQLVTAIIIAKQKGVVAGIEETTWILKDYKLKILTHKKDGDKVKSGDKIYTFKGDIKEVLKLERLVLNILQRMSGIATATKALSQGHNVLITATRKTPWGLLDKKAVTVGGGGSHRLGLYDWILVKDNHLRINNFNFDKPKKFWEIEVDKEQDLSKALPLKPNVIMFDNFSPEKIKKNIKQIRKKYPQIIFEASGMINEKTIKAYAKTGVDIVSVGAITHSVKALDLSLHIL